MMRSGKVLRVLALDPASRGLGFAVFEGPKRLIDWGVKNARNNNAETYIHLVMSLIDRNRPHVIAIDDYTKVSSRRSVRIRETLRHIEEVAADMGVQCHLLPRSAIQKTFSHLAHFTKYQIAIAIAEQFPELILRLPRFRKPWMSEDQRMNIFDAAALGLTFFARQRHKRMH